MISDVNDFSVIIHFQCNVIFKMYMSGPLFHKYIPNFTDPQFKDGVQDFQKIKDWVPNLTLHFSNALHAHPPIHVHPMPTCIFNMEQKE